MKRLFLSFAVAAALVLAGCANAPKVVRQDAKTAADQIAASQAAFRAATLESERRRIAAEDVQRPYIAGNTRPLSRELSMPETLRRSVPVTAMYQRGPVDLETALRQISEASGILITATADALLPPSAFSPRTAVANSPVQPPVRIVVPTEATPLWRLLDEIARQAQLSWRPRASGAEFYRVETRVFQLAGTPQVANTTATLGRNGGSNSIFESTSKTGFETKDQNQFKGFMTAIDAMLSTGGKAQLANESQTLVVTDTPANLERIAKFVQLQNRIMSRRVRVILEAIEVTDKDSSELGLDWNLVFSSASRALTSLSPATLTSAQSGVLSLGPTTGPFAGSSLVVKALNDLGLVVNRRVFPFLTTSGRPVTQAIRTTFNYVDQVQATSAPAGSSVITAQAPTVTQKEETVGTFVTVVPTAKDDGTIFLSLSFDNTSAQPLVPFTVGAEGASVTVQQKTIDGTGYIQEVPVRSGQTVLVGGLESQTAQDNTRRVGSGAPILLGGSNASKITKTRTLLLVTAVAEEGV
jgi:type IVB pilus formation R64 PilN family outer membrane protein